MSLQETSTSQTETRSSEEGILEVRNLTKQFGGLTAVDELSFSVQPEEILGFIGPNGAGKSTTFNCVTGVYSPTSGQILYRGQEINGEPPHEIVQMGMNRTFQGFAPLEDRSVAENIELALIPDELLSIAEEKDTLGIAKNIGERVGLGDVLDQTPSELPHAGMLKLELGRAVGTKPDLLLIDEPFAGLSGQEVQELSEVIESLRQHGMTLIVIDHNMRGLLNLIDRAFVIQFGSKIAEGSPDEIANDPKVQEAYLGGEEI